jgi:Flp pilus assembly protein TadD
MSKAVAHSSSDLSAVDKGNAMIAPWLNSGASQADVARFPRLVEPAGHELPPIVAQIGPNEVASRITAWRAGNRQLDALFVENAPPAQALRRLALTHWSAGDPRLASVVLATAAAITPDFAPLWLDLGFTLHAIGDRANARAAFERSIALDPAPTRVWLGLALVAIELSDEKCAESAFTAALERDPMSSEAAFGLGLVCFEQRRYVEAARHWRAAVALGCKSPNLHTGLAQSLFFTGDFSGAATAFERQILSGPADAKVIQRFALSRFLETAIAGDTEAAHVAYRRAAGPYAEDPGAVTHSAFHLLSGYGYREAALRIGRERLRAHGDDPVQRYLVDAIAGSNSKWRL